MDGLARIKKDVWCGCVVTTQPNFACNCGSSFRMVPWRGFRFLN